MFRSKLGGFIVICTILRCINRIVVNVSWKCGSYGSLLETRGVRRRLTPELSKIKVRASFVTQIHRFGEPTLRVEAVEDNGVNADGKNFDNDLDESAKQ